MEEREREAEEEKERERILDSLQVWLNGENDRQQMKAIIVGQGT